MKRASVDDTEQDSKRLKSETFEVDPFNESLQRDAWIISQNSVLAGAESTDEIGYLSGKVFMVWPVRGSGICRFQLQVENGRKTGRFEVKLGGRCKKFLHKLDIAVGDEVAIALKGIKIEVLGASSKPYFIPMTLMYNEGVVLKYIRRHRRVEDNGSVISTWELDEELKLAGERQSWFSPPLNPLPDRLISDVLMAVQSSEPLSLIDGVDALEQTASPPTKTYSENVKMPAYQVPRTVRPTQLPPIIPRNSLNTLKLLISDSDKDPGYQELPTRVQDLFDTANVKESTPVIVPSMKPPINFADKHNQHHLIPTTKPQGNINEVEKTTTTNAPEFTGQHTKPTSNVQTNGREEITSSKVKSSLGNTSNVPPPLTKKQQRLLRRRKRKANGGSTVPQGEIGQGGANASDDWAAHQVTKPSTPSKKSPGPQTKSATPPIIASQPEPSSRDPALELQAGFRNEMTERYLPFNELDLKMHSVHLCGVVTSASQSRITKTGDFTCTLNLVDPSNFDPDNHIGPTDGCGKLLTCFTKFGSWLPSVKVDDVLLLRTVRVTNFNNGVGLVGYKDKLRWVAFDPRTGLASHGDRGKDPEVEMLDDGFGSEFSPFWNASMSELTYCLRLAEWWSAVLKIVESKSGQVHRIGEHDGSRIHSAARPRRVHRLVSDASPEQPPDGYFDCTVEIIKGFRNDNGVYSAYVTDYTQNSRITPVQTNWCPPQLADRILKIEMWDEASALGDAMSPGHLWSLRNVRMKVSAGGYMEAKLSEFKKSHQLDDRNRTTDFNLDNLLKRRQEFEERGGIAGKSFEHRLIENVKKGAFFDCTVELLHIDPNPNGSPTIFVTDYTSHPDLPDIPSKHPRAIGLEKRIVKIVLWDEQMEVAKILEPGCYYTIRKLRMVQSTTSDQFQGRLGGAERLIQKLQPKSTTNENLVALLRRKEDFRTGPHIGITLSDTKIEHNENSMNPYPPPGFHSIAEILANSALPAKFRLVARIKDFFPMHLEDFVVLRCTNCREPLPRTRRECVKCYDMVDSTIEYLYHFFFRVEDQEGKELIMSITDNECMLLRAQEPCDLRDDPDALQKLKTTLSPFIGNIVETHAGIEKGVLVVAKTPALNFMIESWKSPAGSICFGLIDVQVATQPSQQETPIKSPS